MWWLQRRALSDNSFKSRSASGLFGPINSREFRAISRSSAMDRTGTEARWTGGKDGVRLLALLMPMQLCKDIAPKVSLCVVPLSLMLLRIHAFDIMPSAPFFSQLLWVGLSLTTSPGRLFFIPQLSSHMSSSMCFIAAVKSVLEVEVLNSLGTGVILSLWQSKSVVFSTVRD